ncbi:hypothetical protein SUDANB140_03873 [Streptomyces sp. enrichment culture]
MFSVSFRWSCPALPDPFRYACDAAPAWFGTGPHEGRDRYQGMSAPRTSPGPPRRSRILDSEVRPVGRHVVSVPMSTAAVEGV